MGGARRADAEKRNVSAKGAIWASAHITEPLNVVQCQTRGCSWQLRASAASTARKQPGGSFWTRFGRIKRLTATCGPLPALGHAGRPPFDRSTWACLAGGERVCGPWLRSHAGAAPKQAEVRDNSTTFDRRVASGTHTRHCCRWLSHVLCGPRAHPPAPSAPRLARWGAAPCSRLRER